MSPDDIPQDRPAGSFKRQIILVLIAGLITVLLTPVVTYLVEHARWHAEQKVFVERSRNEVLLSARRKFIEDFSEQCWKLQLAMIDVPFARQQSEDAHLKACLRYGEMSADAFGRLRALSEGSVWYTSPKMQSRIDHHIAWLLEKDLELVLLMRDDAEKGQWSKFHTMIFSETQER